MTTVPMRCGVCGKELGPFKDPMAPPIPLSRVRICRRCRQVVCRRDSVKVGRDEFECVACSGTAAR